MFHATTILGYIGEKDGEPYGIIGGDGQVTSSRHCIVKTNATKIRTLYGGQVLAGFAGSTADAFTLYDMFDRILEGKKGDLIKSVVDFAKAWRQDKYLRKLDAMMIVLNYKNIYLLTGSGDVMEPDDCRIAAVGSGGDYALSAARALDKFSNLDPDTLVLESLKIAGGLCAFTNTHIKMLSVGARKSDA